MSITEIIVLGNRVGTDGGGQASVMARGICISDGIGIIHSIVPGTVLGMAHGMIHGTVLGVLGVLGARGVRVR